MANGETHVVSIVPDGITCAVEPEATMVLVGDTVSFQNLTDSVVQMFFPNSVLFGTSLEEISPESKMNLTVAAVPEGTYDYNVYYKGREASANRAARPRVIVYRLIP